MADPAPYLDPSGHLYFSLAFVAASAIVVLYCWPKFDEPSVAKNDNDFITQFLPRDLASSKEYSYGLLTYVISMLILLAALSALGPPVLKLVGIDAPTTSAGAAPLVVALALVGLLPNVPVLKDLELAIRRFAHRRAFIPAAARATAERLTVAKFDFTQYCGREALGSEEMGGVAPSDFATERGSIEYNWARLCCLCYALRLREDEEAEALDRNLLKAYRRDVESIYERRSLLASQIAQFRQHPDDAVLRRELRAKIRDSLEKLYILIGCSTRLCGKSRAKVDAVLRAFGFELEPVRTEPHQGDVMIVGLAVMTGFVLAVCFAASEIGKLGLWQPSPDFPTRPYDAFIWSFSTLLTHGVAILTADRIRGAMLRSERWYDADDPLRRPVANYIRIGIVCAAVGYVVMVAFGVTQQPPTWAMAQGAAPYAMMPAVTGAFYAAHVDNAELNRRPSRRFEILSQAFLTSAVGLVASDVWVNLGGAAWPSGIDFVVLVGILGIAIGASLAWYIPENAIRRKIDPLSELRESRIREATALAAERLGTQEAAERWLNRPSASLQGASPIAALAEAGNYEEILRLINTMPPAPGPAGPPPQAASNVALVVVNS
jgi:hypothetical protein